MTTIYESLQLMKIMSEDDRARYKQAFDRVLNGHMPAKIFGGMTCGQALTICEELEAKYRKGE